MLSSRDRLPRALLLTSPERCLWGLPKQGRTAVFYICSLSATGTVPDTIHMLHVQQVVVELHAGLHALGHLTCQLLGDVAAKLAVLQWVVASLRAQLVGHPALPDAHAFRKA